MFDITSLYGRTQLETELMGFYDDDFTASNNFVDTLFETKEMSSSSYSSNSSNNTTSITTNNLEQSNTYYNADFLPYNNVCYDYHTDSQLLCLSPSEILLPINDDFQQPKRQKIHHNALHYSDILFEPPACTYQFPESFSFSKTRQQIQTPQPAVYSIDKRSSSSNGNGNSNGGLSAQSVAARQRRRKISEKTQALGKLIPGGNRMNTAEMFHAAYKYVKFLQAQIGLLQLMRSKANENFLHCEELEALLASPTIQEKLYSEEKCLVPQEFVEVLFKDPQVQSNPSFSKEIDLLNGPKEELTVMQTTIEP